MSRSRRHSPAYRSRSRSRSPPRNSPPRSRSPLRSPPRSPPRSSRSPIHHRGGSSRSRSRSPPPPQRHYNSRSPSPYKPSKGKGSYIRQAQYEVGRCKWFDTTKGFGFIEPDQGGPDVFTHQSALQAHDYDKFSTGAKVEYTLKIQDGKQVADQVIVLEAGQINNAERRPRNQVIGNNPLVGGPRRFPGAPRDVRDFPDGGGRGGGRGGFRGGRGGRGGMTTFGGGGGRGGGRGGFQQRPQPRVDQMYYDDRDVRAKLNKGFDTGSCKWFDHTKGFGFIKPDREGRDIFVHQSILGPNELKKFVPDARVEYKARMEDGRFVADIVVFPSSKSSRIQQSTGGKFKTGQKTFNNDFGGGGRGKSSYIPDTRDRNYGDDRFNTSSSAPKTSSSKKKSSTGYMETGTCKWFDVTKGYGFITSDRGGPDVFVHQSDIYSNDPIKSIPAGTRVEFTARQQEDGRWVAENVTGKGGALIYDNEKNPMFGGRRIQQGGMSSGKTSRRPSTSSSGGTRGGGSSSSGGGTYSSSGTRRKNH